MKIRIPLIAACLLVAGVAVPQTLRADEAAEPAEASPHRQMQNDANASAQAATDMSYGGMRDTRSESGDPRGATDSRCWPRARCDIFFGQ
jgi:hypothetical protein